jgi:hypothetical protein
MTNDQRSIALQKLANIVIDAYLDRDKQFVPEFAPGVQARMYLRKRKDDHPDLRTKVWYRRSDYEPAGLQDEDETPTA